MSDKAPQNITTTTGLIELYDDMEVKEQEGEQTIQAVKDILMDQIYFLLNNKD